MQKFVVTVTTNALINNGVLTSVLFLNSIQILGSGMLAHMNCHFF